MKKIYLTFVFIIVLILSGCSSLTFSGSTTTEINNDNSTVTKTDKESDSTITSSIEEITTNIPTCRFHMDDDNDGVCDICGEILNTTSDTISDTTTIKECRFHMDDDNDGVCDVCGKVLVERIEGTFLLTYKTINDYDVTNSEYLDYIVVSGDDATWYNVNYSGLKKTECNASYSDNELTITVGIKPYVFSYDKDSNTLSFDGTVDKKNVEMVYTLTDGSLTEYYDGVSFTDELFGDPITENFYNYCPSIMMEGNDTMHIWYCTNKETGKVTDYIGYRKGTLHKNGTWSFSEKMIALSPTADTFDSVHTCDPSVIKGEFKYKGESYTYLMAYLGVKKYDCTCNEVGLAVSNSPSGPFVKYEGAFCNYYESSDYGSDGGNFWGYGQPSLVSVDKKGQVLLFYTKGVKLGTFTCCEKWDLSNLDNPILLNEAKLADGGAIEVLNNADFTYDPITNRIYCVKEDHVNGGYPTDGGVNWIPGTNSIYYMSLSKNDDQLFDSLFKSFSWAKVGTINESMTGYPRNHNSGILTDEYGWLIDYKDIPIVYTMSEYATDYPDWNKGGQWPALHTYRLHGFVVSAN